MIRISVKDATVALTPLKALKLCRGTPAQTIDPVPPGELTITRANEIHHTRDIGVQNVAPIRSTSSRNVRNDERPATVR